MKNNFEKEYIPPQCYSVDGLFEIISALENNNDPIFAKDFQGPLLDATRKKENVRIDKKLMQELEMSAESVFKKGLILEENYNEIVKRISDLRSKYEV